MVYDCFQFFNELDILKIRLNVLSPVVDKFVISEATETFSGLPKPLYYEENKEMFREFEDKIIHQVVTDIPAGGTHERDEFLKNAVARGLTDCTDDDVIIFSDMDEIPNPDVIRRILDAGIEKDKIYHFAQRLFYCYLNMEEVSGNLLSRAGEFDGITGSDRKWLGSKMLSYQLLREKGWHLWDIRFPEYLPLGVRVADGGWHFGYMGGHGEADVRKRVQEKVISAAHQEYNNRRTLDRVQDMIKDGNDISILLMHWNHNFRHCSRVTGDVTGKLSHIRNDHRPVFCQRSPAYSSPSLDLYAGRFSLKGSEQQFFTM